jgi:pyruvate-ferredoxin/flavodoxin oxidoreductase
MSKGYEEQKKAVACGYWSLYRFDPRLRAEGKNPLQMDSKAPTEDLAEYAYGQNRYRVLQKSNPKVAAELMEKAKVDVASRFSLLEKLSQL